MGSLLFRISLFIAFAVIHIYMCTNIIVCFRDIPKVNLFKVNNNNYMQQYQIFNVRLTWHDMITMSESMIISKKNTTIDLKVNSTATEA